MSEKTFRDELEQTPLDLPRAALRIAKEIAYPDLEVESYLTRLDQLAGWADEIISPIEDIPLQAMALAKFLFRRFGFHGTTAAFSDPRNSYLNDVLDRLFGIPVSLSLVYLSVADRLGISAGGVGMPGHFIVNVPYADGEVWLDPFHQGRELSSQDLTELVQASNAQAEAEPNEERLKKVPPKDILARLLSYLKLVYLRAEAWDHAQAAIERLRLLHPENPDYLRDMGYIHDKKGSLRLAVRLYEAYLSRSPNAVDSEAVRHNLEEAAARLARLN